MPEGLNFAHVLQILLVDAVTMTEKRDGNTLNIVQRAAQVKQKSENMINALTPSDFLAGQIDWSMGTLKTCRHELVECQRGQRFSIAAGRR
jgi:hypothetical protein